MGRSVVSTTLVCGLGLLMLALAVPVQASESHTITLNLGRNSRITRTYDRTVVLKETRATSQVVTHAVYDDDIALVNYDSYQVNRQTRTFKLDLPAGSGSQEDAVALARLLDAPPLRFTANAELRPLTIDNWPQVQAEDLPQLTKTLSSKSTLPAIYRQVDARAATKLYLKEDIFLSFARDRELELNTPLAETSIQAGPLGGGDVEYITRTELTGWDSAADEATVDYSFSPTPDSLEAYVLNIVKSVTPGTSAVLDKHTGEDDVHLDLTTTCHFRYAISTGLARAATCQMRVKIHVVDYDQDRTETYTMQEYPAT